MTESRKEWQKPELIVLVRSKPEEAILGFCKVTSIGGLWLILSWHVGIRHVPDHVLTGAAVSP